jgi:hypothetical protein
MSCGGPVQANDAVSPTLRLCPPLETPLRATLFPDGLVRCGQIEFRARHWVTDGAGQRIAPAGWLQGICRQLVAAGHGARALIVRASDSRVALTTITNIRETATWREPGAAATR